MATSTARADVVYGELLGKAGAYGVGYEHEITDRLSLGGAGSFAVVRGEQIATAAPYVHGHLWHALFCDIGAIIAHTRVASPVADWHGMSDTGGGGFASLGLERTTHHVVLRVAGSAIVGEGGIAPALGFAIGWKP